MTLAPFLQQIAGFVDRIEALGFDVSRDAAREALADRTMFNVIDPESGWRADLIVRKARAFSQQEFARRQPVAYLGVSVTIARSEDLILAKLGWAALGASSRQLENAHEVARLAGEALDREYITRWAVTLGVADTWVAARRALKPS